jgi:hypothetical protein
MTTFETVLAGIVRKVTVYQDCGMPRPAWLQRQVDAIHAGNLDALVEGIQDEIDHLDAATITPYHPEEA